MRGLILGLLAGCAAACAAPARAETAVPETTVPDPIALYGDRITFTILRDDHPIGTHLVTFRRSGNAVIAESRSDIRIPFLVFEAYRFDYRARSTWLDGRLQHLDAKTDDDGSVSTVTAARDGAGFDVAGPAGPRRLAAPLLPTEHWLKAMVESRHLLNTITGEMNAISVAALGSERIATAGGRTLTAEHFAYGGDLDLDSWYDAAGRWVKLRFTAKDGSVIEYRCSSCEDTISGLAVNP